MKEDDIVKILVVSDSHLYGDDLQRVTTKYMGHVDYMIHCGDSSLPKNDPIINRFDIVVQGNHDDEAFPIYQVLGSVCVTHGHYYKVYYGYEELIELCQQNHCNICFHGHTHVPTIKKYNDILFVNPGSLMMNRGSYGYGTYALLEIKNGNVDIHFYHHHTDEECPFSIIEEGYKLLEEFKELIK